ncbi:hypothetical protein CDD82_3081 [Ophiocordyceps australis]|uniref:DNA repair metallo-beta-lactamase domain-containing protein n=1 Tax=Ophiocordyceps australis TaxID=1399860 RepID=A0A2C5XSM3_9HYPO|nr:hypothetical protein CDD82_3081 [Ophiocordyceps australis]
MLTGYMCANTPRPGCLTSNPSVRLHSCQFSHKCPVASNPAVVHIYPVVNDLSDAGLEQKGDLASLTSPSFSSSQPTNQQHHGLPLVIRFPFSRHSSYPELCAFVDAFKPRDIWPCTANLEQWARQGISISSLFAPYSSGTHFAHDALIPSLAPFSSPPCPNTCPASPPSQPSSNANAQTTDSAQTTIRPPLPPDSAQTTTPLYHPSSSQPHKRKHDDVDDSSQHSSTTSSIHPGHSLVRQDAYLSALASASGKQPSAPVTLLSVDGAHSAADEEL